LAVERGSHHDYGRAQIYGVVKECVHRSQAFGERYTVQSGGVSSLLINTSQSAGPNAHSAVLPTLDHVSILYSNTLYDAGRCFFLLCVHTSATIPMPAVRLIIHFSNVLASCRYNAAIIKHHACD
jgi:hypothetical protein